MPYFFLVHGPEAEETATFVKMFDEWFDAVKICNFSDGQYQRKPFKNPCRSEEDFRSKVYLTFIFNMYYAYLYIYFYTANPFIGLVCYLFKILEINFFSVERYLKTL